MSLSANRLLKNSKTLRSVKKKSSINYLHFFSKNDHKINENTEKLKNHQKHKIVR